MIIELTGHDVMFCYFYFRGVVTGNCRRNRQLYCTEICIVCAYLALFGNWQGVTTVQKGSLGFGFHLGLTIQMLQTFHQIFNWVRFYINIHFIIRLHQPVLFEIDCTIKYVFSKHIVKRNKLKDLALHQCKKQSIFVWLTRAAITAMRQGRQDRRSCPELLEQNTSCSGKLVIWPQLLLSCQLTQ